MSSFFGDNNYCSLMGTQAHLPSRSTQLKRVSWAAAAKIEVPDTFKGFLLGGTVVLWSMVKGEDKYGSCQSLSSKSALVGY